MALSGIEYSGCSREMIKTEYQPACTRMCQRWARICLLSPSLGPYPSLTGSEVSRLVNHEYDVTVVSFVTEDSVNAVVPRSSLPTQPSGTLMNEFLR